MPIFLAFSLLTNRARIHGMVWVLIIALGCYAARGGLYVLVGHSGVMNGPPSTEIGDNNQLALAVVMQLPLVYYLWKHTGVAWPRFGLALAIPLEILMVFGSHSRGGVIALSVLLGAFWLRTDRKILYGLIGVAIIAGTLALTPDWFWEQMSTLSDVQANASLDSRLLAWHWPGGWRLTLPGIYFPFGVGFYGEQLSKIWGQYVPGGNRRRQQIALSNAGGITAEMPDVFALLAGRRVDLMKLDIKGGEYAILDDPSFAALIVPYPVMEWHGGPEYRDWCLCRFSALDYETLQLVDKGSYGMLRAFRREPASAS